MSETKHIRASYDADAHVWWADSDDVPGLVSEAPTLEGLMDRVEAVAGELMAANGVASGPVCLEFHAARMVQMA